MNKLTLLDLIPVIGSYMPCIPVIENQPDEANNNPTYQSIDQHCDEGGYF
jgi:hypothetical protein